VWSIEVHGGENKLGGCILTTAKLAKHSKRGQKCGNWHKRSLRMMPELALKIMHYELCCALIVGLHNTKAPAK